MFGFLNLNKPAGETSRDVVNQVQRLVRPTKVGHGGTLDPLATGVLVIAIGPATRLIEYVQAQPKTYRAVFRLGQSSDTEDLEGEITSLVDPPIPSLAQIQEVLPRFLGDIQQMPPAYSALKVDGDRAYRLARQGLEVKLQPRVVSVYRLTIVAYSYPDLEVEIECGGGTYVRSLGRDLARAMGSEALMASLVRTAVGPFTIDRASDPGGLTGARLNSLLIDASRGLEGHPVIQLSSEELRQLQNGRPLERAGLSAEQHLPHLLAFDDEGRLQAMLKPTDRGWRVAKSFWDAHGMPPIAAPRSPQLDP